MERSVSFFGRKGSASVDIDTENGFLLQDRVLKIRSIMEQYGEENFYVSFSGGKDSVILSELLDIALPGNEIPRVYANTGIDLNIVRNFVFGLAKKDKRIVIVQPKTPIKPMLEAEGYPFKSKHHSHHVERFQRIGMVDSIKSYLGEGNWGSAMICPKALKYQFSDDFNLKISDHCCVRIKEEPLTEWGREQNRPYTLIGIMPDEGGRRTKASCLAFSGKKLKAFQPLVAVNKAWEEWFIETFRIEICEIYKPPYNRERTGCKGCPFALHLQEELDMLEKFFPAERKQCEILWKPVYDEYRRLGYRLRKENQPSEDPGLPYADYRQMTIFDFLDKTG